MYYLHISKKNVDLIYSFELSRCRVTTKIEHDIFYRDNQLDTNLKFLNLANLSDIARKFYN